MRLKKVRSTSYFQQTRFFCVPNGESRKLIINHLNIDPIKFYRTFDMVYLPNHPTSNTEALILSEDDLNSLILIELKTTKKCLPHNPKRFFFSATENEFYLAQLIGDRYKLYFISLYPDSLSYKVLKLSELNNWNKHRRLQYQISLK